MKPFFSGGGQKNCPLPMLSLGFLALALAVFSLGGCVKQSTGADIAMKHEFLPDPPHVGAAILRLNLADRTASAVLNARVGIEADMAHPGMAPRVFEVKELGSGHYQSQLQFDMAGDWVILLHINLSDGKSADRQLAVRVVESK